MENPDLIMGIYRTRFAAFNRFAFRELHPRAQFHNSPYIDLLADKLEACARGDIRRLIINVPPRSLKSHSASVALPVWMLGRRPDAKIMSVTGSRDLANDLESDTQRLLASPRLRSVFPHLQTKLSDHVVATSFGGTRISAITKRTLLGRGADIIIVDDPMTPKMAQDETARKMITEWFDTEVMQRLNDKAKSVVIVVMQRLHADDLSGHLIAGHGDWEVLSLPAIAREDVDYHMQNGTSWHRSKGGVLCHERETMADLRKRLTEIGSLNFQAQYLQIPNNDPERSIFWESWPLDVLRMRDPPPFRNETENREWGLETFFDEEPVPVDDEALARRFEERLAESYKTTTNAANSDVQCMKPDRIRRSIET